MDAVNALIAAGFRRNRANLRNVEIGFDSRTRCRFSGPPPEQTADTVHFILRH